MSTHTSKPAHFPRATVSRRPKKRPGLGRGTPSKDATTATAARAAKTNATPQQHQTPSDASLATLAGERAVPAAVGAVPQLSRAQEHLVTVITKDKVTGEWEKRDILAGTNNVHVTTDEEAEFTVSKTGAPVSMYRKNVKEPLPSRGKVSEILRLSPDRAPGELACIQLRVAPDARSAFDTAGEDVFIIVDGTLRSGEELVAR